MKNHYLLSRLLVSTIVLTVFVFPIYAGAVIKMQVTVDATEMPKKLLHSKISLNLSGDSTSLLYPKWIPGIHAPKGPIENLGGFEVEDRSGKPVRWERDWAELYRFFVFTDKAEKQYDVSMTYICNQQSVNSSGIDSYGTADLGIISWNTNVVYPEGIPVRDIMVDLKLILPKGWDFGSALPFDKKQGDTIFFKTVTLEELIDMPLIAAEYFRTVKIASTDLADYYIHLAAHDESSLDVNDSIFAPLENLVKEGELLFSRTHFKSYHFLLVLSDQINGLGVEHRNSSLNNDAADGLKKLEKKNTSLSALLAHEFPHAWCGKYRRPAGMDTPDFISNKNTDLLWFYEGLDQYIGNVLEARSGLGTEEYFKEDVASAIEYLKNRKGRSWRSLRDTQVSSYLLRQSSASWTTLRRNQDYYDEGAMIWMEFDARIRNATNGEKSLDDFCAVIFGSGDPDALTNPITLDEIISTLSSFADEPWEELINERVNNPHDDLNLQVLDKIGYAISTTDKKSDQLKYSENRYKFKNFYEALGFSIRDNGTVYDIVIGSLADKAGLYSGVEIIGVNGKKFSLEQLEKAVKNSTEKGKITLLFALDDNLKEVVIEYNKGLQYFTIVPVEGKPDRLKEIIAPRAEKE